MGWSVATKNIEGEIKYKFKSSNTDKFITPNWCSRKEIIEFLFWHRFDEFINAFLKDSMTFPEGWCNTRGSFAFKGDKQEEFYKLILKAGKAQDQDMVIDKFFDSLNELGIELKVTDGKYGIDNAKVTKQK